MTRRDLAVALGASVVIVAMTPAGEHAPVLRSSAFEWSQVAARPTNVGSVRAFFRAPTATLDELELHVTTLNAGQTSHAPHTHPNEELVIVKEGVVEVLVGGEWKRLGPGSVVFSAANELHGLRNASDVPAVYHVINWKTHPAAAAAQASAAP